MGPVEIEMHPHQSLLQNVAIDQAGLAYYSSKKYIHIYIAIWEDVQPMIRSPKLLLSPLENPGHGTCYVIFT